MALKKNVSLSDCRVFFDFDNTITPFDVIDDIVGRFSRDERWRRFEQDWKLGKIGSKECLKGQLKGVRVNKDDFIRYLSTIKVDAYFPKILQLLKAKETPVAIISDSFSFIIKYILENNGIEGIKIYSNDLEFSEDRFIIKFPHLNKKCPKCANCKKSHLLNHDMAQKMSIYIGDGLSDICPAKEADMIFAKDSLRKHLKKIKAQYIPFDNLAVVYERLKELAQ
jgi:2,3-diketo-5-methylthio-1-phosphopentane phosphatase